MAWLLPITMPRAIHAHGGRWRASAKTGATLAVRNSTISGNIAEHDGGGLYFYRSGSLVMENCTVSGNSTTNPTSNRSGGGGLYLFDYPSANVPDGFVPAPGY